MGSASGVVLLEFIIILIVKLLLLVLGLVGELLVLLPQRQQLRPGPALLRPDGRSKLLLKPDNCVWPKTRSFRPRISISIQLQLSDQQQQIQRIQRLIHSDTSELLSNINTSYKI